MKIAITGASGFVGTALGSFLHKNGYDVEPLHQSDFREDRLELLKQKLSGCDGVVNLAGASISVRWTPEQKRMIYESRIRTTRILVETINALERKPSVLVSASAVGHYPSTGIHDEDSAADPASFLAKVTRDWEAEAAKVNPSVRLVILRFGIILGTEGGMFPRVLNAFSKGIGVVFGTGKQSFSWIHIDDLLRIILKMLHDPNLSGVFNCVAPGVTDMLEFTDRLSLCTQPYVRFRLPGFILKTALLGGSDLLLKGQHVVSKRLKDAGFEFRYPDLDDAITELCGEERAKGG